MQWIAVLLTHQNNKGIQIVSNRIKTFLSFTREKKEYNLSEAIVDQVHLENKIRWSI